MHPEMPPIPEDDRLKLQDMVEKFKYFLRKYEGYGLVISNCNYWKDGEIRTESRIEFTKIGMPKMPPQVKKVFS